MGHGTKPMHVLTQGESLDRMVSSTHLALVLFGSDACMPCHAIRQKIERWLSEPEGASVAAIYVPMEECVELAAQMGVLSVPTVRLYAEGRPAVEGAGHFSLDEILTKAERYEGLISRRGRSTGWPEGRDGGDGRP